MKEGRGRRQEAAGELERLQAASQQREERVTQLEQRLAGDESARAELERRLAAGEALLAAKASALEEKVAAVGALETKLDSERGRAGALERQLGEQRQELERLRAVGGQHADRIAELEERLAFAERRRPARVADADYGEIGDDDPRFLTIKSK